MIDTIVGVLIGSGITWLIGFQERKQAQKLAELNREDKYRLFINENRTEAYQEAYLLCIKMIENIGKPYMLEAVASECDEWWVKNCLYLNKEIRDSFHVAFIAVLNISSQSTDNAVEKDKICDNACDKTIRKIEEVMGLPEYKYQQ